MNEVVVNVVPLTASLSEISMSWLLVVAAGMTIFSLVLAWLATLILYGKVAVLKKAFPAPHNLVLSHVDYIMMTSLLAVTYFVCLHLSIVLPNAIIVILCIGVIYNPFGFILKAINPKAGQSGTLMGKIAICIGFLPATIGFGYAMYVVIAALV